MAETADAARAARWQKLTGQLDLAFQAQPELAQQYREVFQGQPVAVQWLTNATAVTEAAAQTAVTVAADPSTPMQSAIPTQTTTAPAGAGGPGPGPRTELGVNLPLLLSTVEEYVRATLDELSQDLSIDELMDERDELVAELEKVVTEDLRAYLAEVETQATAELAAPSTRQSED